MTENELRQKAVNTFAPFMGAKRYSMEHERILDAYNSISPLPRGFKMTTGYDYCAATVSAIGVLSGLADIFPLECSCTLHIQQLQKRGAWIESDTYIPKPGDLIYYDWDDTGAGDDTGGPEHVGMVEKCDGKTITVMEGNTGGGFGRRTIAVGGRYIRGFGALDYKSKSTTEDKPMNEMEQAKQWAIENGIIQGYGDGNYGWDDPLTRKQFVTILFRLFKKGILKG